MRMTLLAFPLLAALPLCAGWFGRECDVVKGTGPEKRVTVTVGAWQMLRVEGPVDVTIAASDEAASHAVELSGPADAVDAFEARAFVDRLRIGPKAGCVRGGGRLRATVSAYRLHVLKVSGAATVKSAGALAGSRLYLNFSGAAAGELELDYESLHTRIEGSGALTLRGKADRHEADLSGAGDLKAAALAVTDCDIEVSGSGSADIAVTGSLDATVSGSGTVRYHGQPARLEKSASGSASVRAAE